MPISNRFRAAAASALQELLPIWIATPLADQRRVFRPNGPGNFQIILEGYRGTSTWIAFRRLAAGNAALTELDDAIGESQPELRGYVSLPGLSIVLQGAEAFVTAWLQVLGQQPPHDGNPIERIDALLDEFSLLLDRRVLTRTTTTAISELSLPDPELTLRLSDEVVLRALTVDEIAKLSEQDTTFGRDNDLVSHSVNCGLVHSSEVAFTLSPLPQQQLVVPQPQDDGRKATIDVLRALHALKTGRAGVFQASSELSPPLLPVRSLGTQWPLYRTPFASLEMESDEVETFIGLFRAVQSSPRAEVLLAADRLIDAESRLSPVDALLDATIGLETLLNPVDSAELAFRVALNYAFIGLPEDRRDRYNRIRSVQKVRNRIVHGGLSLQSPDAALIHEQAILAKASLRDAVKSFLLDPALAGNRRLDADFWLDRILPNNVLVARHG